MKGRPATWVPFKKWHKINNWREPWNKWKNLHDDYFIWDPNREEKIKEFSDKYRKIAAQIYKKVTTPWYKTKIEQKLEDIVKNTWLKFMTQYELLGITCADIYVPDKRTVIYADWDYWHNYPYWNKRDYYINKELKNCWFKVYRFWERDINNNTEEVERQIIEILK